MTDYIIIGLLAVNLICLLIFLSKNNNKNNNEMIEKLGKFETDITKSIGDFKFDFSKVLGVDDIFWGNLTRKVEPTLYLEDISMVPFINSTNFL